MSHKDVQSVLFPRSEFTIPQARAWLRKHKLKAGGKVHTTDRFHRFRQQPPNPQRKYLMVTLESGVRLVVFKP